MPELFSSGNLSHGHRLFLSQSYVRSHSGTQRHRIANRESQPPKGPNLEKIQDLEIFKRD